MEFYHQYPPYQIGKKIIAHLAAKGYQAYLVGGAVRDVILGTPQHLINDIDVATDATPETVMKLFPQAKPVNSRQAYPICVINGVEVATFRRDLDATGRHEVTCQLQATLAEDAARRDLTINALYEDPENIVHDPTGRGITDLHKQQIRFVGDGNIRITEDPLRMLRAIRFAAQLEFGLSLQARLAIIDQQHQVQRIPIERIQQELMKMLGPHRDRARAIQLLYHLGLLQHILPEIVQLRDIEQCNRWHREGHALTHTLLVLDALDSGASTTVGMAALLHDVGKATTQKPHKDGEGFCFYGHDKAGAIRARDICTRLRFSNSEIDDICWLVENHMKVWQLPVMRRHKVAKLVEHPQFNNLLLLARADEEGRITQTPSDKTWKALPQAAAKFRATKQNTLHSLGIDGSFIMHYYGIAPGPLVGMVLRSLDKTLLNNPHWNKEQLLRHCNVKQMRKQLKRRVRQCTRNG